MPPCKYIFVLLKELFILCHLFIIQYNTHKDWFGILSYSQIYLLKLIDYCLTVIFYFWQCCLNSLDKILIGLLFYRNWVVFWAFRWIILSLNFTTRFHVYCGNLLMFGRFQTRKFKNLSILLISDRNNINLISLVDFILFTDPSEASKLLPFLVQLPLLLLSDSDILLFGFIDFPKALKNWDLRSNLLVLGEYFLFLGRENRVIRYVGLENSPII